MECLLICPKGQLIYPYWNQETKVLEQLDASNKMGEFLFTECEISNDVTLRDIFVLLNNNKDLFTTLLGPWFIDLLGEVLNEPSKKIDNLNYLELYWQVYYDENPFNKKKTLTGFSFPSFRGIGHDEREYDISLSNASELAHLTVKLKDNTKIFEYCGKQETITEYEACTYTLGQIIYGIFQELTFYGDPSSREEMVEKLKSRIESIDEKGLVSMEDLFEDSN